MPTTQELSPRDNRVYWIYSFASMLSPFLLFTLVLILEKMNDPRAFEALRPGTAAAAVPGAGFTAATHVLLAVGLGCSLGLSLNIIKMKKFPRQGMMEYLAFLTNGVAMMGVMIALVKLR